MSQFWDTFTPDCSDCKIYERDLKALQQRIADLEQALDKACDVLWVANEIKACWEIEQILKREVIS